MLQNFIHYFLHFGLPVAIAFWFYRATFVKVSVILLSTMLVDLDHLAAVPIFDPERCSLGFHFLHSYFAIACYVVGLFFKKTRIVAMGLVLHMIADGIDCLWNYYS